MVKSEDFGKVFALHASRQIDESVPDTQLRWTFGPTCYVLRDVRALTEPVPCGGHQWFWELSPELEARVLAGLPGAA